MSTGKMYLVPSSLEPVLSGFWPPQNEQTAIVYHVLMSWCSPLGCPEASEPADSGKIAEPQPKSHLAPLFFPSVTESGPRPRHTPVRYALPLLQNGGPPSITISVFKSGPEGLLDHSPWLTNPFDFKPGILDL